METVRHFIFWGLNITADGDHNYEIKICLLLGKKILTTKTAAYYKSETLFCQQKFI